MAAQRRFQVVIYGRTYRLVGADAVRTRELAQRVDEAMRRFSETLPGAESYQLAILAALHLADELKTAREEFATYRSRVNDFAARVTKALENSVQEEVQPRATVSAQPPPAVAAGSPPTCTDTKPAGADGLESISGASEDLPVDIPEAF